MLGILPVSAQAAVKFFEFGTGLEAKARIQLLAKRLSMKAEKVEVSSLGCSHDFAPNQYARTLTMPEGLAIVGKIHKHSHVNVISKGKCYVATFEGEVLLEAPCTFVSPAGVQRAVYCLEETVWTTIHTTAYSSEEDLDKIEQEIIATSYADPALPITIESPVSGKELIL